MFIYKLTFASGKIYIGQTVKTVEHRFNHHRNNVNAGSALPVHNAWRKHGAPSVEVLMACATLDDLNQAEARLIAEFGSVAPNGYNLSLGGSNAPKHPDTRAKISARRVGFSYSDEQKAVFARATAEKWRDPEYRAKVKAGVAASFTEERRRLISESSKAAWARRKANGYKMPEQQVEAMRNRVASPETKAKMSAAAKARKRAPLSAEARAKIAAKAKAFWADPDNARTRKAQLAAAKLAKKESQS